ncbi:MAG: NUDIX domain-containing protein [Desulfatirhabdiaceae bacterium]
MTISVQKRSSIYKGRVFELTAEEITLPNNTHMTIDIIRHPGASAIVPVLNSGNVVLLRQYRHAVGGDIWEIPAGTFDGPEDPLICAKRELTEETGYIGQSWTRLGEITPVPGYSDERIHLFLAAGLTLSTQNLDVDEVIQVHDIAFKAAMDMVFSGEIQDAKTIAGLCLAARVLQNSSRHNSDV